MDEMTGFIKDFLKRRDRVSVPEIQQCFGLSYSQARKALAEAMSRKWVASAPEGLYYEVNRCFLAGRSIELEEYDLLAKELKKEHFNYLERIARKNAKGIGETPIKDADEMCLKELLILGLVHRFEDAHYLSIDTQSFGWLLFLAEELDESVELQYMGKPILYNILCKGSYTEEDRQIVALPFVSKKAREYIEKGLERNKKTGWRPSSKNIEGEPENNALVFEMIEALVVQCDYSIKSQYVKRARACLALIEASDICTDVFKKAAREATRELDEELTEGNIREIRRIVMSEEDEDDD